MTGLREHGPGLIKNGYSIVPIAKGFKFPKGIQGWQNLDITQPELERNWLKKLPDAGVGIKQLAAIDIDVNDQLTVGKVVAWCREHIGPTLARRRDGSHRVLLPYRPSNQLAKLKSHRYTDRTGDTHQLEVLGQKQQFVAYGVHPKSGNPYQWVGGELSETERRGLPTIVKAQALALIEYFESVVPKGWEPEPGSGSKLKQRDKPVESKLDKLATPVDLEPSELERLIVEYCEPQADDYEQWLMFGMALWHQFSGGQEGFQIWDRWSRLSSKYEDGVTETRWPSFAEPPERPVTARYILSQAREGRLLKHDFETPLEEFLSRFVYVVEGELVADSHEPAQLSVRPLAAFHNEHAAATMDVDDAGPRTPSRTKEAKVSRLWLASSERKTARGFLYRPGQKWHFPEGQNQLGQPLYWINACHLPKHPVTPAPNTAPFDAHMRYLFPIDVEREWFVDWLAFNIQRPWKRSMVTPLHVSTEQGTGRGWLVALIRRLLGDTNCSDATIEELCGEGSSAAFNQYMDDTLFCAVEETAGSSVKRYQVEERLRLILTSEYQTVNRKYGTKENKKVFTNFFFMSNRPDALALPAADRRFNVFSGPFTHRPDSYYRALYNWLDTDGVAGLWHELQARDLSEFNWQRSMRTEGRKAMVLASQSETEMLWEDFMAEPHPRAMTYQQVYATLLAMTENPVKSDVSDNQLRRLLQVDPRVAGCSKRVRYNGGNARAWVFDKSILDDAQAIRTELEEQKPFEVIDGGLKEFLA